MALVTGGWHPGHLLNCSALHFELEYPVYEESNLQQIPEMCNGAISRLAQSQKNRSVDNCDI
jgi:hypothetical protein